MLLGLDAVGGDFDGGMEKQTMLGMQDTAREGEEERNTSRLVLRAAYSSNEELRMAKEFYSSSSHVTPLP